MKTNVVWRLVLKDWQLQSLLIIISITAGVIALQSFCLEERLRWYWEVCSFLFR